MVPNRNSSKLIRMALALCLALLLLPAVSSEAGVRASTATPILWSDKESYIVGERETFFITGAPPNSKILWSSWINGLSAEVNADYGHYTDANGNFSITLDPLTSSDVGTWRKQAIIIPDAVASNLVFSNAHITSVGFPPLN